MLSPAQYSLILQNHGLKHHSFHFVHILLTLVFAEFKSLMLRNPRLVKNVVNMQDTKERSTYKQLYGKELTTQGARVFYY